MELAEGEKKKLLRFDIVTGPTEEALSTALKTGAKVSFVLRANGTCRDIWLHIDALGFTENELDSRKIWAIKGRFWRNGDKYAHFTVGNGKGITGRYALWGEFKGRYHGGEKRVGELFTENFVFEGRRFG